MKTLRIILQVLATAFLVINWMLYKGMSYSEPPWQEHVGFLALLILIWALPYWVIKAIRASKEKKGPDPDAVERPAEETPATPGGTNDN